MDAQLPTKAEEEAFSAIGKALSKNKAIITLST
jgi:hypothetical protein